ncbi:recombination protein U [Paenibacillus sp. DS2015]
MKFEELITYSNDQYTAKGIANIKKVSTPWTVIRKGPKIVNAFPSGPSTVDYMGDWQGRSICFEAKSTKNETSFPFSNFGEHQIEFMRSWKGETFALIHFETFNETYLVDRVSLLMMWDEQMLGGRKSIPYKWFQASARLIDKGEHQNKGIILDYLQAL